MIEFIFFLSNRRIDDACRLGINLVTKRPLSHYSPKLMSLIILSPSATIRLVRRVLFWPGHVTPTNKALDERDNELPGPRKKLTRSASYSSFSDPRHY